jgi:hypothetical protein
VTLSLPGRLAHNTRGQRDFAVTLIDGRRVIGQMLESHWYVYVYAGDDDGKLLGYGTAQTRPLALQRAGLSGDDAGEALGRSGI